MNAAIFDMDGTLIDSMPYWQTISTKYFESIGIKIDDETRKKLEKIIIPDAALYIKEKFNLKDSANEISDKIFAMLDREYEFTVPIKGNVKCVLDKFKEKGYKMCIATGSLRHMVELVTKRLGIDDYFEFVITCREAGAQKSASAKIYEEALIKLGSKREETYVFEDDPGAIKTAKKAGFKVVGIFDEYFKDRVDDIKQTADIYIEDYNQFEML